jgi:hypothetical protein
MTNYIFIRTVCLLAFSCCLLHSNASEGKPVNGISLISQPGYVIADTIPPAKQPEDKPAETKPGTTDGPIIKVVPKAKKQIKPVAIPALPVKPVKIIKPIIKTVGSLIP